MKFAPVYFTVVQARFNPILALDSYAPKIQERLRKHGFPDFQRQALSTINLQLMVPVEGAPPQLPVSQSSRYIFADMERMSSFMLDQNALTFQTTNYDIFDTFSTKFLNGLDAVHDAVELSYIERVGVRYLDAVIPKSDQSIADYLSPSVLGLASHDVGTVIHSFSETRFRAGDINIVARVIAQEGEVGFPPDLVPMFLRLPSRFRGSLGRHATIDTDGYMESREAFNLSAVRKKLDIIHDEITKVFRMTVTSKAIEMWK